ncbi:hypothetical protein EDC94DRAFT_614530 [Helicostylum pulchrum]|nr:hypothetical protein EDC94DRAFT_614530 [Helicostylum pulchrum]
MTAYPIKTTLPIYLATFCGGGLTIMTLKFLLFISGGFLLVFLFLLYFKLFISPNVVHPKIEPSSCTRVWVVKAEYRIIRVRIITLGIFSNVTIFFFFKSALSI